MTIDLPDLIARIVSHRDPRGLAHDHGVNPRATIEDLFLAPMPKAGQARAFLCDLGYDIPHDEVVVIVATIPPEKL